MSSCEISQHPEWLSHTTTPRGKQSPDWTYWRTRRQSLGWCQEKWSSAGNWPRTTDSGRSFFPSNISPSLWQLRERERCPSWMAGVPFRVLYLSTPEQKEGRLGEMNPPGSMKLNIFTINILNANLQLTGRPLLRFWDQFIWRAQAVCQPRRVRVLGNLKLDHTVKTNK